MRQVAPYGSVGLVSDDELMERIAQAKANKPTQYQPPSLYTDEHDTDENLTRSCWPAKVEARIAQTTQRISGGIWTFRGEELVRAKHT